MKARNIITTALLAIGLTAAGQETEERTSFTPHPFMQIQGGAQYTLGEAPFADLLSPNVQIAAGYRFSHILGARIAVNGWQSRGGFNGYIGTDGLAGNATYDYKYLATGADIMLDMTGAIGGYNPKRAVSVTLFAGAGANIAWDNGGAVALNRAGYEMAYIWDGTKARPYGRVGIGIDFRLSDAVSLGIEGNANVLSDKYNSKKAESADWYFNALAGIKIALGRTSRRTAAEEPVAETQAPAAVEQTPAEKPAAEMRREVFFALNSYEITAAEHVKIAELAQYMKDNADARAVLTGYADAETGTSRLNDELSRKRAEAVAGVLTKVYGIPDSRVEVRHEGSRVQPFAENEKNRVTICTAK